MRNVADRIPGVGKLVQVGIRDLSEEELETIDSSNGRIEAFFDVDLKRAQRRGDSWDAIAKKIVATLPSSVYVSFDVDGLDPALCPHTGTPVPGGLQFHEATAILEEVARSGRTIVGFDLNEVSPGEDDDWDANVGARLLYKLIGWTLVSQGLSKPRARRD
jgi:agmatinase